MTDIVERLRGRRRVVVGSEIPRIAQMIKATPPEDMMAMVPETILNEAADEIERLREQVRELMEKPRDDGTEVAYGGEPGASAGKSE